MNFEIQIREIIYLHTTIDNSLVRTTTDCHRHVVFREQFQLEKSCTYIFSFVQR